MKERVLAETSNVRGAKKCIAYLQNRHKTEMVGLGLLYGAPGLGKTRFAKRLAYSNDYIYLRLSRADVELVCKRVSDVRMKSDLLTYIHKTTHGNFRQIIKIIEAVEKVA